MNIIAKTKCLFLLALVLIKYSYAEPNFIDEIRNGDSVLVEVKDILDGETSYAIYELKTSPSIKQFCHIKLKHTLYHNIHTEKSEYSGHFSSRKTETKVTLPKEIYSSIDSLKDKYKNMLADFNVGNEIDINKRNFKVTKVRKWDALAATIQLTNIISNEDWKPFYEDFELEDELNDDEMITLYPLHNHHPLIDEDKKFFVDKEWVKVKFVSKKEVNASRPIVLENDDGNLKVVTNFCVESSPVLSLVPCQ